MASLIWLRGLVRRRAGRLILTAAGVAIAVALLGAIGAFVSSSKATMTKRAVSDVAVDWQVKVTESADPAAVRAGVAAHRGVVDTQAVAFGPTTGFEAVAGGTTQSTGPGVVVGLDSNYRAVFPGELRDLAGAGSGVLLAQQTAANLHAAPGDNVTVHRSGLPDAQVRVDGVVDLPFADSLFQQVGAPVGARPQAPPDNIVIVPTATFDSLFAPAAAPAASGDAVSTSPAAAPAPDTAALPVVERQVHARLSHALPTDPATAYNFVNGSAKNLETALTGGGVVGDNLATTLGRARSDALYAQLLFLFLGLPGAVLAGLLTAWVAASGADRRRREQALLRVRGATLRQLGRLATAEALLVGAVGAIVGLAGAAAVGRASFGSMRFGATTTSALGWAAGSAVVGLGLAWAATALPARRDARRLTVAAARQAVARHSTPMWARWGVDGLALAGALWVFWVTGRNGYRLVLATEGVATISVNYWAFAGPALLWLGAGLLTWRITDMVLHHGRRLVAAAMRPLSGQLSGTIASALSRQRRLLSRALVLVALTGSFAASTAVFNATYQRQADVKALLRNGADVTVTNSPGSTVGPEGASRLAAVAGVRHVEPLQHRFAYVGADLQDIFGVQADTIVNATKLQDAYFTGGTARSLMARLKAEPDALLVSAETVKDFQLVIGDKLMLRMPDARTHQLVTIAFHYIGVVKEFPTAPGDSFLIANADYIARTTGSPAVRAFLVDSGKSSARSVANRMRSLVGTSATVTDVTTSRGLVGSSLTAVDLAGLTRVELGFALLLAAATCGLAFGLGLVERRRMFAITAALGARPRQLAGFVWSEAVIVGVGGMAMAAVIGWTLSEMLVKILTRVIDPPPQTLAVPWVYLGAVAGLALAGAGLAASATLRATRRPAMAMIREL